MNVVHLIGNTGKEPELKQFDWGAVVQISLATTKAWKNKEGEKQKKTSWHNLEFRGKVCDVVMKYVKKGQQIAVTGEIDYQEYEKDGQKRTITKIIVNEMELLGSKTENVTDAHTAAQAPVETDNAEPVAKSYDDDLPF
jgi:single-strand DNA-binding protein